MKAGWDWRPLGEVCKTGSGATPLKTFKEYYEGGKIPWLLSGEVAQGEITEAKNFITEVGLKNSAAKLFPANSVLIAMYGATAGQVGILRFESATNQAVCAILPNPRFVPEYLFYVFLHLKENLIATATGNAQPNISQIKIKSTVIPIPPLDEQRRIVAVLDKAFAGISTATANVQKNLINARALFEHGLSDSFQNDDAAVSLGSIAKFVRGPFGGSLKKNIFQPSGFAIYEQQHAIYDQFSEIRYFVGKEKFDEMVRFQIHAGDILMSCSGTIGRVALVPEGARPGIINQALLKLSPSNKVFGEYLLWYMRSHMFREQIAARSGGAALQNVASVAVLKEITFPLPEPSDQLKIVSRIKNLKASTDTLMGLIESKLAALTELKQSLLQKAFAGELT